MMSVVYPVRFRAVSVAAMLLVFALACRAVEARAGKPHPARTHEYKHEVEALEEQWRVALLNGDASTMDKLLSDDYVGISMDGLVNTKAQQLERIRKHKLVLTRIDQGEMRVKMLGQVAIVTSSLTVAGTNDYLPFSGVYRYMRVYHRTPGEGWQTTSFEVTRMSGPENSKSDNEMKTH